MTKLGVARLGGAWRAYHWLGTKRMQGSLSSRVESSNFSIPSLPAPSCREIRPAVCITNPLDRESTPCPSGHTRYFGLCCSLENAATEHEPRRK